jgi:hypothetical protein
VNREMHTEAVLDRVWRCTGRPRAIEFGAALVSSDGLSVERNLETEIE